MNLLLHLDKKGSSPSALFCLLWSCATTIGRLTQSILKTSKLCSAVIWNQLRMFGVFSMEHIILCFKSILYNSCKVETGNAGFKQKCPLLHWFPESFETSRLKTFSLQIVLCFFLLIYVLLSWVVVKSQKI